MVAARMWGTTRSELSAPWLLAGLCFILLCNAQVIYAICGDGIVDGGEECDDGVDNHNVTGNCTEFCTFPTCGDGITQGDEECDDGNLDDGDDCLSNCTNSCDCAVAVTILDEQVALNSAQEDFIGDQIQYNLEQNAVNQNLTELVFGFKFCNGHGRWILDDFDWTLEYNDTHLVSFPNTSLLFESIEDGHCECFCNATFDKGCWDGLNCSIQIHSNSTSSRRMRRLLEDTSQAEEGSVDGCEIVMNLSALKSTKDPLGIFIYSAEDAEELLYSTSTSSSTSDKSYISMKVPHGSYHLRIETGYGYRYQYPRQLNCAAQDAEVKSKTPKSDAKNVYSDKMGKLHIDDVVFPLAVRFSQPLGPVDVYVYEFKGEFDLAEPGDLMWMVEGKTMRALEQVVLPLCNHTFSTDDQQYAIIVVYKTSLRVLQISDFSSSMLTQIDSAGARAVLLDTIDSVLHVANPFVKNPSARDQKDVNELLLSPTGGSPLTIKVFTLYGEEVVSIDIDDADQVADDLLVSVPLLRDTYSLIFERKGADGDVVDRFRVSGVDCSRGLQCSLPLTSLQCHLRIDTAEIPENVTMEVHTSKHSTGNAILTHHFGTKDKFGHFYGSPKFAAAREEVVVPAFAHLYDVIFSYADEPMTRFALREVSCDEPSVLQSQSTRAKRTPRTDVTVSDYSCNLLIEVPRPVAGHVTTELRSQLTGATVLTYENVTSAQNGEDGEEYGEDEYIYLRPTVLRSTYDVAISLEGYSYPFLVKNVVCDKPEIAMSSDEWYRALRIRFVESENVKHSTEPPVIKIVSQSQRKEVGTYKLATANDLSLLVEELSVYPDVYSVTYISSTSKEEETVDCRGRDSSACFASFVLS